MAYPIQSYNPNNGAFGAQQVSRPFYGGDHGGADGDFLNSLFGLASQLMGEILRSGPDGNGVSSFMGSHPDNPHLKVFGVSSMNVTQVSRGLDGRPHIVQAQDERWMGPNGVWQTKKALHDPDRGIEKMQVGYFAGDQSEIIEHQVEPSTIPYQQRGFHPNGANFAHHWPRQPQQAIQRPPQPYQYFPQQQAQIPTYPQMPTYSQHPQIPTYPQQLPPYGQQRQQALPPPPPYQYF